MTKLLSLSFGVLLTSSLFAQSNSGANVGMNTNQGQGQGVTRWKLDGNTGTGNEFIGTTNQQDLILKSGNEVGLRITPGKDVKIPGQIYMDLHRPTDPGAENIVTVDYNGKIQSLDKSGLSQIILSEAYSEPCMMLANVLTGVQYSYPAPTWATSPGSVNQPGILWTGDVCAPAMVGIGTDSPIATLDVSGSQHVSGNIGVGANPDGNSRVYIDQNAPFRDALTVELTSTSSTASGVGIKTIVDNDSRRALTVYNSSNSKDVFRVMGDGHIWATEVSVRIKEDFPDYVFNEEYKLMSIEDLEKYILENNHLPKLPTAEDVDNNGLEIGELNRLLVEKVEELTLYTIEQQKLIIELQQKLSQLEKSSDKN